MKFLNMKQVVMLLVFFIIILTFVVGCSTEVNDNKYVNDSESEQSEDYSNIEIEEKNLQPPALPEE